PAASLSVSAVGIVVPAASYKKGPGLTAETIPAAEHIEVFDEILEEDFDALLDEGSKILYSIKGTPLEDKIFARFDKFIAMNIEENFESESNKEEIPVEKNHLRY
nr:reverse transcriptase domain-containing protein [Tanacetum cinerariifolium]